MAGEASDARKKGTEKGVGALFLRAHSSCSEIQTEMFSDPFLCRVFKFATTCAPFGLPGATKKGAEGIKTP
jgi:hypothetical protein